MVLRAALPLEFRKTGFSLDHAVGTTKEILLNGDDIAYSPVVNPLDGFSIACVIAAVQARYEGQSFLFCQIGSFLYELDADRIDTVRLLHKHVLSAFDRRHGVERMELRRVGNHDDV